MSTKQKNNSSPSIIDQAAKFLGINSPTQKPKNTRQQTPDNVPSSVPISKSNTKTRKHPYDNTKRPSTRSQTKKNKTTHAIDTDLEDDTISITS